LFSGGEDQSTGATRQATALPPTREPFVLATAVQPATMAVPPTPRLAATLTAVPAAGATRTNAIPIGQTASIESKWQLSVVAPANIDAWPTVQAANRFNQAPSGTERVVLIRLKAKNIANAQNPAKIDDFNLRLIGSGNQLYTAFDSRSRCGVIPDELDATLFPNGEATGNVCFRIPSVETGLLLAWKPSLTDNLTYFRID
jgi:hypothetical protein